jgi:small-conductance mechanosensitive channel
MPTAKAVLALLVSGALCAPASAQVKAAASAAGLGVPRLALSAPLSAPLSLAPSLSLPAAPLDAPSVLLLTPAAPAPAAVPALVPGAPAALAPAPASAAPLAAAAPRVLRAAQAVFAAGTAPRSKPASSLRGAWERFWSGAASRNEEDASLAVPASESEPAPLSRPVRRPPAPALAAAVALAPAAHGLAAVAAHASPFLEGGAVLAGTYFANRGVHALLNALAAKRGMDRHKLAVVRLVASVVLWTAATAAAMKLGGASPEMMTTVFGAGGTILTLGLKDALGNAIQGVNFLITRPYAVGASVSIDDQVGTVTDVSLTQVLIRKDDGSEVKVRHSALAAKPVVLLGAYSDEDPAIRLSIPARPKFQGALGAVWKSLDWRFWASAGAFAVLLAAPGFVTALAAGWAATIVHYALAGSIVWLTRRVGLALTAAVNTLAAQNSWHPETAAIARLAVNAALWGVGGSSVLRMLGVSWTALGASVGLTTLGVGLASNNFFGSIVQGAEVLFSKPFKVGDRVTVGTFSGVVEDMTLYHVVVKLDEGRHALVPYAVVRDATLVVQPGLK